MSEPKSVTPRRAVAMAVGLGVAFGLAGGALWSWRRAPARQGADAAALAFFALTLPDADGVQRPLKTWQGKLLIVNFWATWCTPCVEEMPELQRLADQSQARNVAVIGIGVDEADKVRAFRTQHGLRFPLLVAGFDGMGLAQRLGNTEAVLPYTALISPDGRLVEEHSGRIEAPQLRHWMAQYGSP
ncbi:MAG TPA: TlpA disulfide reductase family protein [Burkholderiaceae bacterium]|jgi:peroxiredoxin|nr:TlpA disulfide reductase family protein [Burkholderiaceae bacterium]